jgi:putative flippase GtrA
MTAILANSRERERFLKFAIVGTVGAVVDFGVMNLTSRLFGFSLVLAGTISFIAAILSNFTWNRYWTYPDSRSKALGRQLIQFSVVSVAGLIIRIPVLVLLEPIAHRIFLLFGFSNLTTEFLSKNFTLAVAVIIVMFWNFFINRYWTYNDVT